MLLRTKPWIQIHPLLQHTNFSLGYEIYSTYPLFTEKLAEILLEMWDCQFKSVTSNISVDFLRSWSKTEALTFLDHEAEAEAFAESWSWSRSRSFNFLKPRSWSRSFSLKSFGFVKPKPKQLRIHVCIQQVCRLAGLVRNVRQTLWTLLLTFSLFYFAIVMLLCQCHLA